MTTTTFSKLLALGSFSLLTACISDAPPPVEAPPPPKVEIQPDTTVVSANAEIGGLNEDKTNQAFDHATARISTCFSKGAEKIPYLAGDINFYVRVSSNGSARYAFVKDSTLGDRDTEECMLGVLKGASWPKPVGGEQGIAERQMHFDAGGDERPPVSWSPEQLGKPLKKARRALHECVKKAGTGPMKATLYVETDGKAQSIGVAVSDEKGEEAIPCVIDVLKSAVFPSPGSYASKVTVDIP